MGNYKLIDLDLDEKSIVRRALYQEGKTGERVIRRIFDAMLQVDRFSNVRLREPRWETSIHPLYFWAYKQCKCEPGKAGNYVACFDHVLKQLPKLGRDELRIPFRYTVLACEIDILIEDLEYFLFVEVKIPVPATKVDWYKSKHGAHQLVHQYVQGKILEKLLTPKKEFALVTVGANNGKNHEIQLNDTERELLSLVEYNDAMLSIPDFPLKLLTD